MRSVRLIPLLSMAAALMAISFSTTQAAPPPAPAPANATPRVAVANPSVIFAKMRETIELKEKLKSRQNELAVKKQELHDEIEKMIQDRESSGYNPNHPKYIDICEQIDKKKADFQAWGLATKASVERQQKMMVKTLYDKIEAAVAVVARQNNIDLVIADGRRDVSNLEDISPEELQQLLNTRAVLYSNKTVDITEMVIAVLDQQFAAAGGTAVPPPLPGNAVPPPSPK